jgi:hypothetical protein
MVIIQAAFHNPRPLANQGLKEEGRILSQEAAFHFSIRRWA